MKKPDIKIILLLLIAAFIPKSLLSTPIKVTGKVTDGKKNPIPGVTVAIKGTERSINTDIKGRYSLSDVPSNGTLQFSFIGYKKKEIAVKAKCSINVIMEESVEQSEMLQLDMEYKKR